MNTRMKRFPHPSRWVLLVSCLAVSAVLITIFVSVRTRAQVQNGQENKRKQGSDSVAQPSTIRNCSLPRSRQALNQVAPRELLTVASKPVVFQVQPGTRRLPLISVLHFATFLPAALEVVRLLRVLAHSGHGSAASRPPRQRLWDKL